MYTGGDTGQVMAFDANCNTGGGSCTPIWHGPGNGFIATPIIANGVVYSSDELNDRLYGLAEGCNSGGAACSTLFHIDFGVVVTPHPSAISDGVLYVSADNKLEAFALPLSRRPRLQGSQVTAIGARVYTLRACE